MDERHAHDSFPMPHEPGDRFGAPGVVAGDALGRLVCAAFDGCKPCQADLLGVVQDDALTVTRLVELAAVAVAGAVGGIPPALRTPAPEGRVSTPFAVLMDAGADADEHTAMYQVAASMSDAERREAADDALDLLVGQLVMGAGDVDER